MVGGERLICASAALQEGGLGVRFPLDPPLDGGQNGFAVRHGGKVHAYVNRCPHMGTELDWQPGEFFEEAGLYLICSTHGALFEPKDGFCVAGPCRGASLQPLEIAERDGQVFLLGVPPQNQNSAAP
ncbi:MAG TPA: Rieske (2Fe-2S) protein [Usitatibacter sp.]|nr:Rieske (2Fe-2S) protein [Usitatibacter sp.]